MPLIRIALLLALAGLSSGCLRLTFTLNLKPDGSGTIVQTIGMQKAAVAAAFARLVPDVKDFKASDLGPMPFLSEEEVKATAAALGARFVSLSPSDDPALEGQIATFAFDDIRNVRLDLDLIFGDAISRSMGQSIGADAGLAKLAFTRENGRSIFVLDMPNVGGDAFREAAGLARPDEKAEGVPDMTPETAKMVHEMLDGAYMEFALNFEGTIISTDAPFVEGTKVVLLRMDFSEMLKTAKDLGEVVKKMEATPADAIEKKFEIPGIKVATQPKIRIEFR